MKCELGFGYKCYCKPRYMHVKKKPGSLVKFWLSIITENFSIGPSSTRVLEAFKHAFEVILKATCAVSLKG